jgi:Ca-activated chloride channel family protein
MLRVLDQLASANLIGFLTFSNSVNTRVPVGPLSANRFLIRDQVEAMRAAGGTGLYDAIEEAVRMSDEAEPDLPAIRGVVVLTDGRANAGRPLDGVIAMSANERPLRSCRGFEQGGDCLHQTGQVVTLDGVLGEKLAIDTKHGVHIFYVGLGGDVDIQVGRLLAEATGSNYVHGTEQNIATVLENFGKYF